jgi:hypothetical protein
MMLGKLKLFLTLTGFLIVWISAACLQKNTETDNSTTDNSAKSLPVAATPKNSPTANNNSVLPKEVKELSEELSCSPTDLKPGDILTLKMRSPHGSYLEVITPKKKYIFLSELDGDELVEAGKKAGAKPFYAASDFAKLDELKINTAEATTVDVEKNKANGKYQLEKIFSASGKYKILLSEDSFETDEPTITGQCEVSFTNVNQ